MSPQHADPQPSARQRRVVLAVVAGVLALDTFVYGIGIPILPIHAAARGLDIGDTGLLFATLAGAQLLTLLAVLRFGARFRPQRLLWAGFAGFTLSALVFALSTEWTPGLFVARALHGFGGGLVWVGGPALVSRFYGDEERGAALGIALGVGALGSLIGPPTGGALYDAGGFARPYQLAVGLAIAAAVIIALIRRSHAGQGLGMVGAPGPGGELKAILRQPRALAVLAIIGCGAAGLGLLEPLVPAVLHETLGTTGFENGIIFGIAVLFYGLLAPVAGALSDRIGRVPISVVGMGLLAVSFMLLPLGTTRLLMGGAAVVAGIALGLSMTPTMPALAEAAESDAHGPVDFAAVYALHTVVYAGGLMLGPSLGGYGVEHHGLQATVVVAGAVTALVALMAWTVERRARP